MKSSFKELFLPVPWGNLALITWGDPSSEPVLMMHGRVDSAATFIPLVEELPPNYYYVGVDLPGHGKSDAFPKGIVVSRFHYIHAIDVVVKHMGWKNFIFMGHSMGCEIGLFYNASTPGQITRFIHLDVGPTFQRLQQPDHVKYYRDRYHRYYANYRRYNSPNKVYSSQHAVQAVMRARSMSEEQAQTVLSRNMVPVGDDQYRLSWDSRSKYPIPQNMTNELYLPLFTVGSVPTLFIIMTEGHKGDLPGREGSDELIELMLKNIRHSKKVILAGDHDHHVTHPGEIKKYVMEFLNEKFDMKSKL